MATLLQDMIVTTGGSGRAGVAVMGEVDASNAGRFRLAILDAAGKDGGRLEVDLAGVTFMDSTGLRAMADASLALDPSGAGLVLCNVPRHVQRILEILDFGSFLEVRTRRPLSDSFRPTRLSFPLLVPRSEHGSETSASMVMTRQQISSSSRPNSSPTAYSTTGVT